MPLTISAQQTSLSQLLATKRQPHHCTAAATFCKASSTPNTLQQVASSCAVTQLTTCCHHLSGKFPFGMSLLAVARLLPSMSGSCVLLVSMLLSVLPVVLLLLWQHGIQPNLGSTECNPTDSRQKLIFMSNRNGSSNCGVHLQPAELREGVKITKHMTCI